MAQNETTIYLISQRTTENEFSIDADDIILMDHGTGSKRHRAFTVQELIDFVKDGKLDGMTIGGSGVIKTSSGHPVIINFYSIAAGIIEASTKFKVGGSEWTPGSGQPKIEGLYALKAGNVGVNNLQTDSIDSLTANTDIEVKQKLVKDSADATKMLDLGPTKVNGALSVTNDAVVTGDLEVYGDATLTGSVTADGGFQTSTGDIKSTSGGLEIGGAVKFGSGSIIQATAGDESTITTALSAYAEGRTAIIVNKSSTDLQFNNAIFAKTTFQVPAYSAVSVVKVDGKVYALIGENV